MNYVKGWRTSEFKVIALTVLVNLCGAIYLFGTGRWEEFQALLTALLGSNTLAGIVYGWLRTRVKVAALQTPAETVVVPPTVTPASVPTDLAA